MGLEILAIIYIVLAVTTILLQFYLYKDNSEKINFIFIANALIALIILFLAFSALPSNYYGKQMIVIGLAVLTVLSLFIKVVKGSNILSKIFLTMIILASGIMLIM